MACRIVFDLNDEQGGHDKSQRINCEGGIDASCTGNNSTQSRTQAETEKRPYPALIVREKAHEVELNLAHVDLEISLLDDASDVLGDALVVSTEAVVSFQSPVFAQVQRATQAKLASVQKLGDKGVTIQIEGALPGDK